MAAPGAMETTGLSLACGVVEIAAFAPGRYAFMLSDGTAAIPGFDGERPRLHDGVTLAAAAIAGGVLSGGDDGRLVHLSADGAVTEAAAFGRDWPAALAVSPGGDLVAVAAGKTVRLLDAGWREVARFEHASTVGGVAFDPRGKRVVAAHYGGATMWMANPRSVRRELKWKGSHLLASWSPCGRFIMTAMQEPALHGWRVDTGEPFHMDGYPFRIKSLAWTDKGRKLVTPGGPGELVVWPFVGQKGPIGKPADVVTLPDAAQVERVLASPEAPWLAVGRRDGAVVAITPGADALTLIEPAQSAPVAALAADGAGGFAFGRADGTAGMARPAA
jgi:hypothetical protein